MTLAADSTDQCNSLSVLEINRRRPARRALAVPPVPSFLEYLADYCCKYDTCFCHGVPVAIGCTMGVTGWSGLACCAYMGCQYTLARSLYAQSQELEASRIRYNRTHGLVPDVIHMR